MTGRSGSIPATRIGKQVVMLGGLQRHVHAGQRAELARPNAGRVDDDLRLDLALLGADGGDAAHGGS